MGRPESTSKKPLICTSAQCLSTREAWRVAWSRLPSGSGQAQTFLPRLNPFVPETVGQALLRIGHMHFQANLVLAVTAALFAPNSSVSSTFLEEHYILFQFLGTLEEGPRSCVQRIHQNTPQTWCFSLHSLINKLWLWGFYWSLFFVFWSIAIWSLDISSQLPHSLYIPSYI